jgi:uncharacterized membrane protein
VYALAWLFLIVAVASLLLGQSRAGLTLIYASIASSVLAMIFVVVAVIRRPVEPRGTDQAPRAG